MERSRNYWRETSLTMLFTLQAMFLGTTIWDFFLTVIIKTSARGEVFSLIYPGLSAFILVPWILCIFILSIFLFRVLMHDKTKPPLLTPIHFGYGIMASVYATLTVLALLNPIITWALVMNYVVNTLWAIGIVYFRLRIARDIALNR